MELSQLYFEQLGNEITQEKALEINTETTEEEVLQCKDCLTMYNEVYGDITQNIEPFTAFDNLPDTYECSLCEAPKSSFEKKVLVK